MAKFRVWAKMTTYAYLDVEANSADEATRIAEDADGGEFTTCDNPLQTGDDGWEIMPDPDEV